MAKGIKLNREQYKNVKRVYHVAYLCCCISIKKPCYLFCFTVYHGLIC